MHFIKVLETTKKFHQEILASNFNDKQELSRKCDLVTGLLRDLIHDIMMHAAKGSGPRRKEWHIIRGEIAAVSDDVRYFERNGKSAMITPGVISAYDAIVKKIYEMGDI